MCIRADFWMRTYVKYGVDLANFRSYDRDWQDHSRFFSTIDEVVAAAGEPPIACDIPSKYNSLFRGQAVKLYVQYTGDTDGVVSCVG